MGMRAEDALFRAKAYARKLIAGGSSGGGVVDTALNANSQNAVANSAVTAKFDEISKLVSDDASEITVTYKVTNKTLGVAASDSMSFSVERTKVGKIHYLTVEGGAKIYSTTTATYEVEVTIELPEYFKVGKLVANVPSTNITAMEEPTFTLLSSGATIKLIYTQPNSTSKYSPDSLYKVCSTIMLIEN